MNMNRYDGTIRFDEGQPVFNGGSVRTDAESGVTVFFCGSFFNLGELVPQAESPAEAILRKYLEHGSLNFLGKVNGAFAVAVFDEDKRSLMLARDRLGAMPLFYFKSGECFAFAHTLGRLKQFPAMPREIDLQALHDYLALQYVPSPRTLYREVWKMRPGAVLTVSLQDKSMHLADYWVPDFSRINREITIGVAAEELRGLMEKAVKRRIPASGHYAALLSGGLDSTIVTALTAKNTGYPLPALTMGFDQPEYDERDRAAFAVNTINRELGYQLDHRVKVVQADNFRLFEELVQAYGEPYADASLLPTHLLCRWAKEENMAAAFNGDAADELFAGYERYLVMRYANYAKFVPRGLFKAAAGMLPKGGNERSRGGRLLRTCRVLASGPERRYLDIICRFNEEERRRVYDGELAEFQFAPTYRVINDAELVATGKHVVERMQEVDMRTYMPGDVLPKAAIAADGAGISGLAPFLDNDVMDFAMKLPLKFKQSGASRKHILKIAFPEFIPAQIATQRKKGFGVPVGEWLRGPWHELMCAHLLEGNLVKSNYFKKDELQKMIDAHQRREADFSYPLWSLTVLDLFL